MAEHFIENRFHTGMAYLKSISRSCVESQFMGETGRNDMTGMQHFMTRLKGLDGDAEKMEA